MHYLLGGDIPETKCYIQSVKHENSKEVQAKKKSQDNTVIESQRAYESEIHPQGETSVTLSKDQKLYCVKVIKAFLKAGIPLSKIKIVCELLEEHVY